LKQGFDAVNRPWGQQNVAADGADLGGNVVDDDHLSVVLDSMHHQPRFIFAGTALNGALHAGFLL
jgi:hypothetical protein